MFPPLPHLKHRQTPRRTFTENVPRFDFPPCTGQFPRHSSPHFAFGVKPINRSSATASIRSRISLKSIPTIEPPKSVPVPVSPWSSGRAVRLRVRAAGQQQNQHDRVLPRAAPSSGGAPFTFYYVRAHRRPGSLAFRACLDYNAVILVTLPDVTEFGPALPESGLFSGLSSP